MENYTYTYIDLFAGCGGLSLGFYNSGWKGLFAIEKSTDAFQTLEYNLINKKNHFDWPKWLPKEAHDINVVLKTYHKELNELKGKVTLVTGGPPCQGFSMAGRRNPKDERNSLIDSYIKFIKLVEPKILFFENVKGFTIGFKNKDSRENAYSNYVTERLTELNYDIHYEILDFSNFGVPQKRKRFILVGVKGSDMGVAKKFFEKIVTHKTKFLKEKGLTESVSLEEAISDLLKENGTMQTPDRNRFKSGICSAAKSNFQKFIRKGKRLTGKIVNSHSFPFHSEDTINKFKYILEHAPKNISVNSEIKKEFDLQKRTIVPLDSKLPTPTLTTLPDDYIHYIEPRILTVREYARIQTFPDWFEMKGKYTTGGKLRKLEVPRYTQIGNAIPPLFGELSATVLKEMVNYE